MSKQTPSTLQIILLDLFYQPYEAASFTDEEPEAYMIKCDLRFELRPLTLEPVLLIALLHCLLKQMFQNRLASSRILTKITHHSLLGD